MSTPPHERRATIQGLMFAGTSTTNRVSMRELLVSLTGQAPHQFSGADADIFELPDGSAFAVADDGAMGSDARSLGFLVDDIHAARDELAALGIATDDIATNERFHYFHFVAPDGNTYEMVEGRTSGATDTGDS